MKHRFPTCLVALALIPFPTTSVGQWKAAPPVYFAMDWCPEPDELTQLRQHLQLHMSGCCVFKGIPVSEFGVPAGALSSLKHRVVNNPDFYAKCTGQSRAIVAAEEEALRARLALAAQEIKDRAQAAPAVLRALDPLAFCAAYGVAIRDRIIGDGEVIDAPTVARAEAKRRRMQFDDKRVIAQRVGIGASRCALYAAWGQPTDVNRTISRAGVDIQHVFGRSYVYTANDIVTAIQD